MIQDSIATEALVQRGRTPLYNDLVSLYQDTQEALSGLKKVSPDKYNVQLKLMDYPKKLKQIIHKHMGITISKVEVVESRGVNAFATFDVSDSLMKQLESGKKSFPNIIDTITSVYDDHSASIKTNNTPSPQFGFHFGIYVGFWRMRNPDGSFHFSADELAAVTLHEIGHFDHWIRTMSQPIIRTLDASDLLDYVKHQPDRKMILTILSKLKTSKHLDASWSPILKTTDKYFKSTQDYVAPEYTQAVTALETLIVAEISSRSVRDFNVLSFWGMYEKAQTPTTKLYEIDAERSADEFASRNGAYAPLASALQKMNAFNDKQSLLYVKQFMWTFPGILVSALSKFSALLQISAEDIAYGYDPIIRRLELIAQTAKHAYADSDLPQDVKDDIRQQIQVTETYIRERERSPYRVLRKQIKEWKDAIGKFGRIIGSPLQSRLQGDYHRLQDANRDLGRHSLYYLADK